MCDQGEDLEYREDDADASNHDPETGPAPHEAEDDEQGREKRDHSDVEADRVRRLGGERRVCGIADDRKDQKADTDVDQRTTGPLRWKPCGSIPKVASVLRDPRSALVNRRPAVGS